MLDSDGAPIEQWTQLPRCLVCRDETPCNHARLLWPTTPEPQEGK